MSGKELFAGGVTDQELVQRLRSLLGCDPTSDSRIFFWAVQCKRLLWARRHRKLDTAHPGLTRRQVRAIDQGLATLPACGPTAKPTLGGSRRGRPETTAMNFANKLLLEQFPQIEAQPLLFAGLERLHLLDELLPPTSRLARPEDWVGGRSGHQRLARVRNRTKYRIELAKAQKGVPGVAKGDRPGKVKRVAPGTVPTASVIGDILHSVGPLRVTALAPTDGQVGGGTAAGREFALGKDQAEHGPRTKSSGRSRRK